MDGIPSDIQKVLLTDQRGASLSAPLSRRDHFAMAAMREILRLRSMDDRVEICRDAVEYADELIKTLDRLHTD